MSVLLKSYIGLQVVDFAIVIRHSCISYYAVIFVHDWGDLFAVTNYALWEGFTCSLIYLSVAHLRGLFWLVRHAVTVPPIEGVAYLVLDWLMQVAVVGIQWQWMTCGRDVLRSYVRTRYPILVTRSHMWTWVRRNTGVFCYILLFFCCFENSFNFLFVFYLSLLRCDVWHRNCLSESRQKRWCKKQHAMCNK